MLCSHRAVLLQTRCNRKKMQRRHTSRYGSYSKLSTCLIFEMFFLLLFSIIVLTLLAESFFCLLDFGVLEKNTKGGSARRVHCSDSSLAKLFTSYDSSRLFLILGTNKISRKTRTNINCKTVGIFIPFVFSLLFLLNQSKGVKYRMRGSLRARALQVSVHTQ